MNELIPIHARDVAGATQQTVNARDLHEFLEVGKDFTSWVKVQIERVRLTEGRDYLLTLSGENPLGGRPRAEYHLTLDAAKHVGMMSGTDKGFAVRDYFLECERKAKAPAVDPASLTRMDLLKMAMDAEQERIALAGQVKVLAHEVEDMEPKAEFVDRFVVADGLYGLDNAARALNVPCRKFTRMLVNDGYLHYEGGVLVPYAKHKSKGWFEVKSPIIEDKPRPRTYITPAGFLYFANLIQQGELFPELTKPVQKQSVVAKALNEIAQIVGATRHGLNGVTP